MGIKHKQQWFFLTDEVTGNNAKEKLTDLLRPRNSQFGKFYGSIIDLADRITREVGLSLFFLERAIHRKRKGASFGTVWIEMGFYSPEKGLAGIMAAGSYKSFAFTDLAIIRAVPAPEASVIFDEFQKDKSYERVIRPAWTEWPKYQDVVLKYSPSDNIAFAPWIMASTHNVTSNSVKDRIVRYITLACDYTSSHYDHFAGIDLPCSMPYPWLILGYVPVNSINSLYTVKSLGIPDVVRAGEKVPVRPHKDKHSCPAFFPAIKLDVRVDNSQEYLTLAEEPYLLLPPSSLNEAANIQTLQEIVQIICSGYNCDNCCLFSPPGEEKETR